MKASEAAAAGTGKVHSPKVEKASNREIIVDGLPGNIGSATEAASSSKGGSIIQQPIAGHHPALAKQYNVRQTNKSKTSPGVSQTSLNGSRD